MNGQPTLDMLNCQQDHQCKRRDLVRLWSAPPEQKLADRTKIPGAPSSEIFCRPHATLALQGYQMRGYSYTIEEIEEVKP